MNAHKRPPERKKKRKQRYRSAKLLGKYFHSFLLRAHFDSITHWRQYKHALARIFFLQEKKTMTADRPATDINILYCSPSTNIALQLQQATIKSRD